MAVTERERGGGGEGCITPTMKDEHTGQEKLRQYAKESSTQRNRQEKVQATHPVAGNVLPVRAV